MGLLCDYFAAADDETAAATIDLVGGPAEAGIPSIDMKSVEPTVMMGSLEELLTGRTFDEILNDSPEPVASRDNGERIVVRLTDGTHAALAEATDDDLRAIAIPWSQTEEFWGQGDPEWITPLLLELGVMARTATAAGHRIYCWVCV